jgi:hypothetical protein
MRVGTYPTRHLAQFCYFLETNTSERLCFNTDLECEAGVHFCTPPIVAYWLGLYLTSSMKFWRIVSEDISSNAFGEDLSC